MTTIHWFAYQNNSADTFKVYRAICGIVINFPNSIVFGDVLRFSATSPETQAITMPSGNINDILAAINSAGRGVLATKSSDDSKLFIRATANNKAKFRLLGSAEFLSHTGQQPRTLIPQLEWQLVATVPFVADQYEYSFQDPNGAFQDFYRVASVEGSVESLPSIAIQPVIDESRACVLEGRLNDSSSMPIANAEIIAEIRVPDLINYSHELVSTEKKVAVTDAYGRFSISLLRKQLYLFQIPAVGYNETIEVPDAPSVGLLDLIPTLEGRFTPFEDPV